MRRVLRAKAMSMGIGMGIGMEMSVGMRVAVELALKRVRAKPRGRERGRRRGRGRNRGILLPDGIIEILEVLGNLQMGGYAIENEAAPGDLYCMLRKREGVTCGWSYLVCQGHRE